jgi:sec-independent protein translocase protein TatA
MPFRIGPMELILILAVVMIIFGVGRLPEVFGSVGKGIREFRKAMSSEDEAARPSSAPSATPPPPAQPASPAAGPTGPTTGTGEPPRA